MRLKIDEICDLNKSSLTSKDVLGSIDYLDTSSITENMISYIQKLDYEDAPGRAKRKVKDNTIVYSTVRPNLKHFGILNNPRNNFIVSTGFTTIDVKKEFQGRINPYYLYLLLSNQIIVDYLAQIADIAVSSYPSINPSDIGNLVFDFPDTVIQDRIVSQIKPINEKIALNTRMNAELEAMAKQLYDYWFVQFDFPDDNGKPYKSSGGKMVWNEKLKREIPEGWEVKRIGDKYDVIAGRDCPNIISLEKVGKHKIPIYSNGLDNSGLYGYTDKATSQGNSVTVSARGTIGHPFLRLSPFVPIIRLLVATPYDKGADIFLYEYLRWVKLKKTGSVQPQLPVPEFSDIIIPYPNDSSIIQQLSNITRKWYLLIEKNKENNNELFHLRDSLLPMLMNGQVTIE